MKFLTIIVFLCITSSIYSQTISDKKLQSEPYWIAMINDSITNYFEALDAFEQFWSVRPEPKEEDDILGKGEDFEKREGFFDRLINTKKEMRAKESQEYAFEFKRFKQWQIRVEPWVREDGSIATPAEQMRIWKEEKNKE